MQTVATLTRGDFIIHAIPARHDNIVYLVYQRECALLIDAGEAAPVKVVLTQKLLTLNDILITHHHGDHTAGLAALQPLVKRTQHRLTVESINVPGHTPEDIAFYLPDAGVVFTGDALINGACGRVPSAAAAGELYRSLQRLCELPDGTLVLGGHDYLVDNMHFALSETPDNTAARDRLEHYQSAPADALFVSLAEEKLTNPFLQVGSVSAFTQLRLRKDRF
jgi:hydroxyacylglutathione hydrolase